MRPRACKPTPSALHSLVAAVPAEALRELVLDLLLNGAAETAPAAVDPPRRATKRRRGRPKKGEEKHGDAILKPGTHRAYILARLARRKRAKLWARRQRAAAKAAAKAEAGKASTSPNGNAKNGAKAAEAKGTKESRVFWARAEKLAPNNPWHVVAREFGANEALVKNCFRSRTLPPGLNAAAVERFLEVPAA